VSDTGSGRFSGKAAIVTGAGGNIGAATARRHRVDGGMTAPGPTGASN
jgi:hypothetical protein